MSCCSIVLYSWRAASIFLYLWYNIYHLFCRFCFVSEVCLNWNLREALQFRQFIWRAMREIERDEELRRKGGREKTSALCLEPQPAAPSSINISKSFSKLHLISLHKEESLNNQGMPPLSYKNCPHMLPYYCNHFPALISLDKLRSA